MMSSWTKHVTKSDRCFARIKWSNVYVWHLAALRGRYSDEMIAHRYELTVEQVRAAWDYMDENPEDVELDCQLGDSRYEKPEWLQRQPAAAPECNTDSFLSRFLRRKAK